MLPKIIERFNDLYLAAKGISLYHTSFNDNQYLDKNKINIYQFKKLKKLLIESEMNVPYYHNLFKKINFNPIDDFNAINDINKIPILEKETVRQDPKLFYNQKIKKYLTLYTSGSTGNPLEVRISYNAWIVEQACVWRNWKWAGYKFRDRMAIVRSFVPNNDLNITKYDIVRNFKFYSPFHINKENAVKYLNDMKKSKTKFLRGYPSSIKKLAHIALISNITLPNLKGILVASERLSQSHLEIIYQAFQCKVFNHYGLADVCLMMGNCGKTNLLHNYEDYGYLEMKDTNSKNIKEIIGTNLHNHAMPLIRYKTNDLVELSEEKCSCDINFNIIKNIFGRSDSVIKTKNGFDIPITNFYTMFDKFLQIKQWQIIQENIDNIRFIIKVEKKISKKDYSNLENEIYKRLRKEIKCKIDLKSEFIQKTEGKIPPFISNYE